MPSIETKTMWHRHDLDEGRLTVWIEDGRLARAIAVNDDGVHPRLDRRDYLEQTALLSPCEGEAYARERALDDDARGVLRWALEDRDLRPRRSRAKQDGCGATSRRGLARPRRRDGR